MQNYQTHCLDKKNKKQGTGEMKNYQMTTVNKYVELLDKNLTQKEKTIKSAVERYLYRTKKARANAELLENLLA